MSWSQLVIIIIIIIIIIINPLTARVEGRWGTTDDFATSFRHFSLFSTALWDLPNSRPVHSLMLSSHLFLCPPCLLPPFTVPCKVVLALPCHVGKRQDHCRTSHLVKRQSHRRTLHVGKRQDYCRASDLGKRQDHCRALHLVKRQDHYRALHFGKRQDHC